MPDIRQSYIIENISVDDLYNESLEIFKYMKAVDIQENVVVTNVKEAQATIPSIWGWGGMTISIRLEQISGNTSMVLGGYIAQLGVSPLTAKMDRFLQQLQSVLKIKYGYSFEYERLTRFLPKYKLSFNNTDKNIFSPIIFQALASVTVISILYLIIYQVNK